MIALPGLTPTLPLITLGPVLVTVEPANTPKLVAVPRLGACAWLGEIMPTASPATEVDAVTKARNATPARSRRANTEYNDFILIIPPDRNSQRG